jgi:hypothetical protein
MQIREFPGRNSEFSTANALARIVRRRWQTKTVLEVMAEWDLTEGEAKGVVYAQASRTTIDKIKHHPRGGWSVMLEVDAMVIGVTLEEHLQRQQERLDRERQTIEEQGRRNRVVADRISLFRSGVPA